MKKLLFCLLLAAGLMSVPGNSFAKKMPPPPDTVLNPVQQQDIERGINDLVRYQEERRAKQKKEAMIRISIGAALLVVLVIGLRRRRKK